MTPSRSKLSLTDAEEAVLRTLYRELNIPTDQYPHRARELESLVEGWNNLTSRNEDSMDVLHYMITKRKAGKWEKLGRNAGKLSHSTAVSLTDDELIILDQIHETMQVASDNFALNPELADKLKQEFAMRTGRVMPPLALAAMMINRRKSGMLATLRPKSKDDDIGFGDIEKVG